MDIVQCPHLAIKVLKWYTMSSPDVQCPNMMFNVLNWCTVQCHHLVNNVCTMCKRSCLCVQSSHLVFNVLNWRQISYLGVQDPPQMFVQCPHHAYSMYSVLTRCTSTMSSPNVIAIFFPKIPTLDMQCPSHIGNACSLLKWNFLILNIQRHYIYIHQLM